MKEKLEPKRCAPDDPHRCKAMAAGNQCIMIAIEGSEYCPMHGGNGTLDAAKKASLYDYKRTEYLASLQSGIDHFGKNRDLSEELGILRITLQEILGRCNDSNDLLSFTDKISSTIREIKSLNESILKVEEKIGNLLTADQLVRIINRLVEVIAIFIPDPRDIDKIVDQFNKIMSEEKRVHE